jgi:hypothetical protein
LGREEAKKSIISGREDVFLVHPENGINSLILNWCIGGCWFTPAVFLVFLHMSLHHAWFCIEPDSMVQRVFFILQKKLR